MISVWLGLFMLQNLETALTGGLGQMSLVSDYQTFQPNLGSSSVVVRYRAWWLMTISPTPPPQFPDSEAHVHSLTIYTRTIDEIKKVWQWITYTFLLTLSHMIMNTNTHTHADKCTHAPTHVHSTTRAHHQ